MSFLLYRATRPAILFGFIHNHHIAPTGETICLTQHNKTTNDVQLFQEVSRLVGKIVTKIQFNSFRGLLSHRSGDIVCIPKEGTHRVIIRRKFTVNIPHMCVKIKKKMQKTHERVKIRVSVRKLMILWDIV